MTYKPTPEQLSTLAAKIHEQNVAHGWWNGSDICVIRSLQLVNREISEATEGDRKDLMDDHLPHRKAVEVELADALIRLLDLAAGYGWTYSPVTPFFQLIGYKSLAQAHFWLTSAVCSIGKVIYGITITGRADLEYSRAVRSMFYVAEREGYDLLGAVEEKLEYNKHRADFTPESRAKAHGKKY